MSEDDKKLGKVFIVVGGYHMWDFDDATFGITHRETGETGIFKKSEFLPYLEAFFGLNF